jgi:hypothetical protein
MQQPNPPQPQQQPYPPGQYPPQQPYPVQQASPYPPGQYPPGQYPAAQYPPQHPAAPAPTQSRGCAKDFVIVLVGVVAAVYVVWPSIFPDFVPDFVPVIGQIDDDTAVLVILSCLRYFGLDLTNLFNGFKMLRGGRRS